MFIVGIFSERDVEHNHTKYYSGNKIEKNEMGGACSTYGGKTRSIQDFGGGDLREATTWETQA
jgi:hypothetical protein